MINLFDTNTEFTCIDAGCGNGWLVKYLSKINNCKKAIGVDGSSKMIAKAKKNSDNEFYCSDLLEWKPKNKVDVVFSMEVFYYFKKPEILIQHIYDNWIKNDGKLIMGIDHYYENEECHEWKKQINVDTMELIKIKEWKNFFKKSGFKNVKEYQFCPEKNWKGTLVIEGSKI